MQRRGGWRVVAFACAIAGCGSRSDKAPPARDAALTSGDAAAVAVERDAAPTVEGSDARAGSAAAASGSATTTIGGEEATAARLEHSVFELVDNRHAAHRFVDDELVVDAGDVGFARYTRFGLPVQRWQYGHVVDGERAAVADRLASLELPLTAARAAAAQQVSARVHGSANQSISLRVNGRSAGPGGSVALAGGWQSITIPVTSGRFGVGENQLVFELHGGGHEPLAIAWLRVGAAPATLLTLAPAPAPAPVAAAVPDPRAHHTFDPTARSIELARDAALVWYITVPDGAQLVAEVAGPCRVEVRAQAGDAAFAAGLLGGGIGRVDLAAMSGRVVALSLTARECTRAQVLAPRITVQGASATATAKGAPPRYIVLWVMDALRADRISTFTPGARAQTPAFDELATSSAVFRQYYEQGNESQTSHTSVWTSLYPAVHGVRTTGVGGTYRIAKKFPVMAELLKAQGYATTAVTGNGFVNSDGGYARGFDEFRNMMREKGIENGIIYAKTIVDDALARLDRSRSVPTFLFLGTIDTHGPWIARKPWIDLYSPGRYDGPFQEFGTARELGMHPGQMGCTIVPPPEDIERLRAIYDSAISYQDHELGRFVAQLKAWDIWDQTMLVVTADHGEELFEDSRCGHGGSLRDSLLRVPLLVHYPARIPSVTVDEGAEGIDILPTMLDLAGAPVLASAQGTSLAPLTEGTGRGWARPSYASQYEYAHAMRIGRWKARVSKTGVPLIEDLVADPLEREDHARTHHVERRMLTDNLSLFLALRMQWQKREWGVTTAVTAAGAAALDVASTQ